MKTQHWQDWVNAVLGLWVFISPWIPQFGGAGDLATWNFWIVGFAVAFLAAGALSAFQRWEEWTNIVLGVWLLASPWLLGFSTSAALTWNAVIIGGLVAVFAGWALYEEQGPRQVAR